MTRISRRGTLFLSVSSAPLERRSPTRRVPQRSRFCEKESLKHSLTSRQTRPERGHSFPLPVPPGTNVRAPVYGPLPRIGSMNRIVHVAPVFQPAIFHLARRADSKIGVTQLVRRVILRAMSESLFDEVRAR